jgi:hypothetical protein
MPPPRDSTHISTERLERALRTCARVVVQPGGEVYTPIFERLEAEIEARRRQQDVRSRARELVGLAHTSRQV